MTKNISRHTSLNAISEQYDAFLVDLWGVIHDGRETYPGVIDALEYMHRLNKTIIFLSNAPRRASRAVEGLTRFGIGEHLYQNVITSGEITHHYITEHSHGLGKRYYMVGPSRDDGLLDGSQFEKVNKIQEADFAIITGFDHDDSTLEEKLPTIEKAKKHDIPMICANPDTVVVRITGKEALCAGVIAKHYESIGGDVIYFGKPYPDIYAQALLELNMDTSRIAAIGDNLHTDIAGANYVGIDSYFIAGGIFGKDLNIKHGELPSDEKLTHLCDIHNAHPNGVLAEFTYDALEK